MPFTGEKIENTEKNVFGIFAFGELYSPLTTKCGYISIPITHLQAFFIMKNPIIRNFIA